MGTVGKLQARRPGTDKRLAWTSDGADEGVLSQMTPDECRASWRTMGFKPATAQTAIHADRSFCPGRASRGSCFVSVLPATMPPINPSPVPASVVKAVINASDGACSVAAYHIVPIRIV